jgi:hypothetical protein
MKCHFCLKEATSQCTFKVPDPRIVFPSEIEKLDLILDTVSLIYRPVKTTPLVNGAFCDWDNLPVAIYQNLDAAGEVPTERMVHVGKKKAGALLDGREWKQFPLLVERTTSRAKTQSR